jgi:3-oxocholest-4-en-26-oate---CoA ligase
VIHESYATLWEAVADAVPDAPALVQGNRRVRWRDFERRAARLAGALAARGVARDSKIALYLFNTPEYLEAEFAAFKLRAVPVNVNFRYRQHELASLLDNADADVLLYHRSLAERVEAVRRRLPKLRVLVELADDGASTPPELDGAIAYDELVAHGPAAPRIERSGDDLLFWYTGGTTGLPKGVMWHQGTLAAYGLRGAYTLQDATPPETAAGVAGDAARFRARGTAPVQLPASPLVHATAVNAANQALSLGGTVVLLSSRRFDADELWRAVERERVTNVTIVGDAMGRRMVGALDAAEARGRPHDLSSVRRILSSGAMWSAPVKDALLTRGAGLDLYDALGSSEGVGYALTIVDRVGDAATARFRLGELAAVLDDDGRPLAPGDGVGVLAARTFVATGYYKDPVASARVFRELDGERWAVPGDFARLEADGTVTLLGRGSGCITTGGEKVYPEEVEEVLKEHPGVADCIVVGVPDPEWGECVAAVVAARDHPTLTADDLASWVGERLASYKRPRRITIVDEVRRTSVGKADYAWARDALTR